MSSKKKDFVSKYHPSRFVTANSLASELEEKMLEYLKKSSSKKSE